MPPTPRDPKKPIIITSGPGRPAPIKKQPLPAYGPYKLPLTDVEKRIVIKKRTPKYVDTPQGRIATGGGGVGFFTKGDKGKIMGRVRERAMEREGALRDKAERQRAAASESRFAAPPLPSLKSVVRETKKESSDQGFLEGLADDIGLDDFYRDNVLPTVGRAVGQAFENAKETYGASLVAPGLNIARSVADAVGVEDKIDKPFDYAANLVKGGAGIAKTQGFDRAKPYVAGVIDGTARLGKGATDVVGNVDDFLQTEVPVYDAAKTWADRNAVQPSKDAAVEVLSRVTDQPVNERIDKADEFDRNFIYQANDITQRGAERETAAPQDRRDVWVQMALGEFDDPAWDGYKSPFTREQLERMSDYELANAAYGTHTSTIASLFEAAKNDLKKIGAMPAAIGALSRQIQDANDKGDFRGLGNMAEFLLRQGVSNMVALSKANIYVMTGGKAGNYEDLVRALKAEPILTGLDVASTATLYGKAATFGLKSGGAISKAGAIAGRVPGAARAGEAVARGAGKLAYGERLGAPLARGAEGPSGIVGAPRLGAPLRAAADVGRGLRRIADVKEVEVRDPAMAGVESILGATVGADRTFRPSSSFFSKSSALLRKRLYEGNNPISRAIYKRGEVADASKFRAIASAVVEELGTEYAAPVVKAFKDIFDEDPNLALRVMWDLSGSESFEVPLGITKSGGEVIKLTPGKRADELESVLAGKLWVKRGGKEGDDVFRFSDESPGDGWANVVTKKPKGLDGANVIELNKIEKTNIEQSILLLRKIDEFPEDIVAKARERLEAPYREQFGETIGKRIGGRNAPEGSFSDILQLKELRSMRDINALGVDIDPRVADIAPSVQQKLWSELGIAQPKGGRRELAGFARLQDETIARLMPLVGDEFRAEVEKILGEQEALLSSRIESLQKDLQVAREAEGYLPALKQKVADIEQEISQAQSAMEQLDSDAVSVKPIGTDEALDFIQSQITDWHRAMGKEDNIKKTDSDATADPNPVEKLGTDFVVDPAVVFGKKIGEPTGSNKGGPSGLWEGTDGVKRYVKLYEDEQQAVGEMFANAVYRLLGANVPKSTLSVFDVDGTKRLVIVNEFIEGKKFELTKENALRVLDHIVADALLANWDAVGLDLDNIIVLPDGSIARIDQGGALKHRAMGALKTDEQLKNVSIEDFVNNNPAYKKVIEAAGYKSAKEIDGLDDQFDAIAQLFEWYGGNPSDLLSDIRFYAQEKANSISDDLWDPVREKTFEYIDGANDMDGMQFLRDRMLSIKKEIGAEPKSTFYRKVKSAISTYMGGRGYKAINTWLRSGKNVEASIAMAGRLDSLEPSSADIPYVDVLDDYVRTMDNAFENTLPTDRDMILYRGMGGVSQDQWSQTGGVFPHAGFTSTSFSTNTAEFFAKFGGHPIDTQVIAEFFLPKGSSAIYADGFKSPYSYMHGKTGSGGTNGPLDAMKEGLWVGEAEVILPRNTLFKIVSAEKRDDGVLIVKAVAITPGSSIADEIPEFGVFGNAVSGMLSGEQIAEKVAKLQEDLVGAKSALQYSTGKASGRKDLEEQLRAADAEYGKIKAAQEDIDMIAESLMRDVIESGDIPTGARVHIPTLGSPKGAKKVPLPKEALAGRGNARDLLNVYTGQFGLLGSTEDLERFSGALARNLRIPFVAFESVTRFTDYLMRTGTTIKFSDDGAAFAKQKAELLEAGLIHGNGELGSDYVVLPVNEKTGFLDADSFAKLDFKKAEEVGTKGRSDAGVDDAQIAVIFERALKDNAFENLDSIKAGTRVVILSKRRLEALRKEMAAAAQSPGLLRRITRQWVRFTLTTLPRTPIANVVGSSFLSALGGGLGGYPEAMRILRRGSAPPELLNNGFAGMFDEGGDLVVAPENGRFRLAQRYMNYIYYYNVMGEDLARLSVFMQAMKRGLKNPEARKQIDAELAEAMDLNESFQTLLDAVARGEFANGKALTPELIRIRNDALQKADDFLGGARGLTSRQRVITTAVPFWMWYKHIFKLYFYTLPFKYPGRSLTMNAMARLGAEESARNGFYDSFYEDAIKVGEEVRGQNIYSKGLVTNIFPFNFGGVLEYDEGAPGVQFALSNIAPTMTVPARLAGIGLPGAPIIGAGGERLRPGDVFAPGYTEAALAEAEKLIAPAGLLQSTIAPRSSLIFDAYRLAAGQPLPTAQQRGEGEQYAVTPRGVGGLGLPQSVLDAFTRSFGLSIVRTPVRGPVAERRITDEQARLEEEARKRYRESLGLNY